MARFQDGSLKAPGYCSQGCNKEIAETMTLQGTTLPETVLEELGNQCLVFGQCGDTIAKITGGQETQLAAQATGRAAVVCYRDDGSYVRCMGF
jgi:hypothetical protein